MEKSSNNANKSKNPKMPFAITASKWREIQIKKEEERLKKEDSMKKKREIREQKKLKILKRKNVARSRSSKRRFNNNENICPEGEPSNIPNDADINNKYKIGDYVVVDYEGNHFPGIVKNMQKEEC